MENSPARAPRPFAEVSWFPDSTLFIDSLNVLDGELHQAFEGQSERRRIDRGRSRGPEVCWNPQLLLEAKAEPLAPPAHEDVPRRLGHRLGHPIELREQQVEGVVTEGNRARRDEDAFADHVDPGLPPVHIDQGEHLAGSWSPAEEQGVRRGD